MKIAMWDLECSHLKANFGIILCAGIKPLGETAKLLYKGRKGSDDKKLCEDIKEELETYDMLVSYYGLNFDLKFLNSRLMKHGLEPLRCKYHLDMYQVVKRFACTHSRRLQAVSEFLGIEGKGRVDPEIWMEAAYDGDKKALNNILEHCEEDVIVLEELYEYPYIKQFMNRSITLK